MGDGTIINRNSWLYKDPDDPYALPVSILPKGGFYNTAQYKMLSYDFRAAASYNDVFNDTHIVNVYAGMESNAQNRTANSFDGWGMQYENGEILSLITLLSRNCARVIQTIMTLLIPRNVT